MNGGGEEFCLTISKSQGEARNTEFWTAISGMLESAQLPKSGARRGIWNLEGLGAGSWNLLNSPNPGRSADSGIWILVRAAFLETRVLPNLGSPPPCALSLTVQWPSSRDGGVE